MFVCCFGPFLSSIPWLHASREDPFPLYPCGTKIRRCWLPAYNGRGGANCLVVHADPSSCFFVRIGNLTAAMGCNHIGRDFVVGRFVSITAAWAMPVERIP
ncbi:hypothetical protein EDD15DRAFT_2249120 [Pisolithus albus]|nr:hypothetical protein EDD15DRAFT_2249120 [Pisolithus albus]